MSLEKAKKYLKKYDKDKNIIEFTESSATVSDAAKTIGCREEEIGKTLSFLVNDIPIVVVVSGDARIDNKKFKEEFKVKSSMIPFDDVERLIGHAVGGVCPFGVNEGVEVYLDKSLQKLKIVYPAAGNSNSAVKLTIKELEEVSNYLRWVDICK
ncbi:MAG: YbaK/EbsC family protein [Bacilli bacterium]|nr:YbaK/EbsC family protein [Bacilli bacterium]